MFDLDIVLKNGIIHTFVGIEKKELQLVVDYFQQKKIAVKMAEDQLKLELSEESEEEATEREAVNIISMFELD